MNSCSESNFHLCLSYSYQNLSSLPLVCGFCCRDIPYQELSLRTWHLICTCERFHLLIYIAQRLCVSLEPIFFKHRYMARKLIIFINLLNSTLTNTQTLSEFRIFSPLSFWLTNQRIFLFVSFVMPLEARWEVLKRG